MKAQKSTIQGRVGEKRTKRLRFYFSTRLPARAALCITLLPVSPQVEAEEVTSGQEPLPVDFNRQVRPILSENCYAWHGPDPETREADLRFDIEEWAFRERQDGPPAIVRGDPQNSPLYQRITHELKSERMPPSDSGKILAGEQKETLSRWIREGAVWQDHWAFIKPVRATLPPQSWGNNAIDAFTYRAMRERDLEPNPEADRPTLARRLALDITGLPPTPEMVDQFVQDSSPHAYENLVERLLENPAYGEHQARIWLDAARYSDTHGLHLDNYREIWPYRDWVIDAFNRNQPFDAFVVEQIAGDLLPNPTLEQRLATGFNRCNPTTSEGGAIDDEYRAIYAKNRVETTATVFLGLTMGCASCHDHKFDPFNQEEFYQFSAFFNNLDGPVMDGNAYDTKPIVVIPKPEHRESWPVLKKEFEGMTHALDQYKSARETEFRAWLTGGEAAHSSSFVEKHVQFALTLTKSMRNHDDDNEEEEQDTESLAAPPTYPTSAFAMGDAVDLKELGRSFNPDQPFTLRCRVKLPEESETRQPLIPLLSQFDGDRGWRLSMAITNVRFPTRYQFTFQLIHSLKNNDMISVATQAERNNPRDGSTPTIYISYDGSKEARGISISAGSRQSFNYAQLLDNLTGPTATDSDLLIGRDREGNTLTSGRIREIGFFNRIIFPFEGDLAGKKSAFDQALDVAEDRRSPGQWGVLRNYFFGVLDPEYRERKRKLAAKELEYRFVYDQATVSLVMEDKNATPSAQILERGEYDKPVKQVFADIPNIFGGLPEGAPANRLGLARWLVHPDNPLTARVNVNRFWQNLFGAGLVKTSEDFGIMGDIPSHPDLLDWLALQFQESGWNVKGLVKLMVTSATYRQSSRLTPEKLQKDPENRFLARGPRYRLDGETIRDQALFVSGSLNPERGGPPVKPYQPEGIWYAVAYTDSNTAIFEMDRGEDLYRRSLYTFWKRTAPPPNMVVFDAPSRENCSVRRERTNTPLQALTLMNDPQYVEAARQLAQRAMLENRGSTAGSIRAMYRYAFGATPSQKYQTVFSDSHAKFESAFRSNPQDAEALIRVGESPAPPELEPVELAALTLVANQILNLDSFVNKY
ncbi:MAG: DUF1553 domain-containing protein [Opitutae bacterium]|nr:DUF1553 domain-containing protein [Opitutae bacterium]